MLPTTDIPHESRRRLAPPPPIERISPPPLRRRWLRRLLWALAIVVLLVAVLPRVTTFVLVRGDVVHSPDQLDRLAAGEQRAAIVLGAGLVGEQPSPLLRERIDAAIELLDAGRVDMLVMSGDNTTQYYDEPTVMRRYAIDQGVDDELVAADYGGRRTWDSCARAREVFGIRDAVVVTNAFHVDRALTTCRATGIDAVGYSVSDDEHRLHNRAKWRVRELAATGRALLDAWVLQPEPDVGGDEIDIHDPCELQRSLPPSDAERSSERFSELGC